MKHTIYLVIIGVLVIALSLGIYGAFGGAFHNQDDKVSSGPKTVVTLATGGTSGTYFSIGSGLAAIITKNVSEVEVVAESTGASIANCTMMRDGEVALTLASASTAYGAYHGEGTFEDNPAVNLRGLMSLYPEVFHFVVLKESAMETVGDLKGMRVAIGEKDSGTARIAEVILKGHDVSNDVELKYMSFAASIDALRKNEVDCIVFGSGLPTAAVVDIGANLEINLLEVERRKLDQLIDANQYLNYETIPEGIYSDVNKDVLTVSSPALLIASSDVDDALAYEITKALFLNLEELESVHFQAKNISEENTLVSMSIPLHPGAEKYYRERNMME